MSRGRQRFRLGIGTVACITLWLVVVVLVVLLVHWWMGPSNAEIKDSLATESESGRTHVTERTSRVESKLDSRADDLERRLDELDAKLDRIDAKLDTIVRLINPPLPDGLKRAD